MYIGNKHTHTSHSHAHNLGTGRQSWSYIDYCHESIMQDDGVTANDEECDVILVESAYLYLTTGT